ncbi:MAG TPA: methyltransferase domain-containing protein [Ramlibacter sp.]|nr:methyltransferase domain-containing protein [Ramlibacter sp.]
MFPAFQRIAQACIFAAAAFSSSFAAAQSEVPFITSPDNVTLEMLKISNVGPGDHVIDLGSGDGRIVILAAKRFGATGLGVEIVPDLVDRSIENARNAGVADRVAFRVQDLFTTDLSQATVITMYLLPDVNLQLRPSVLALKPGTRIVSHDWDMGDWKPDRTVVVDVPDKKVGLEKSSKVHLWTVPAKVDGLWCGAGMLRGSSVRLNQRYQEFDGTLMYRKRTRALTGRIDGATLRSVTERAGELVLQLADGQLRIAAAGGPLALAKGQSFVRATAAGCG